MRRAGDVTADYTRLSYGRVLFDDPLFLYGLSFDRFIGGLASRYEEVHGRDCFYYSELEALLKKFTSQEPERVKYLLGVYLPLTGMCLKPFDGPSAESLKRFSESVIEMIDRDPAFDASLKPVFVHRCHDVVSNTSFEKFIIAGAYVGFIHMSALLVIFRPFVIYPNAAGWRPRPPPDDVCGLAYLTNC